MVRLLVFLAAVLALTFGIVWFIDRPGSVNIDWLGYTVQTSVSVALAAVVALVLLLLLVWRGFSFLLTRPAAINEWVRERRHRRGMKALSDGMIAVAAGDRAAAIRHTALARRALPNEPMTALLRAQSAQLNGERAKARALYESMLERRDTELLGLRGLYLEAKRESAPEAALQYADRAVRRDPTLAWSSAALFELQCRAGDWSHALETLALQRVHGQVDAPLATRRRAVLRTAQAIDVIDTEPSRALDLAIEATRLAPDLVPPAELAGRILGQRGETRRATTVIGKTWRRMPHPALARAYTFARPGDAPRDRLRRAKRLAQLTPGHIEGAIAVAQAALEAREFNEGRAALKTHLGDRPSARVCVLMARMEAAEFGDKGREREWLARAIRAPRDPAWIADGVVTDRWTPVTPAGVLDGFEWKTPVDALPGPETERFILETIQSVSAPPPPKPDTSTVLLPPRAVDKSDATSSLGRIPAEKTTPPPPKPEPEERPKLVAVTPIPAPPPAAAPPAPAPRRFEGNSKPAEPKPSPPPRAPDDPGVGGPDAEEPLTPLQRYRMPAR